MLSPTMYDYAVADEDINDDHHHQLSIHETLMLTVKTNCDNDAENEF